MVHMGVGRSVRHRLLAHVVALLVVVALCCAPAAGWRSVTLADGGTVTIPLCVQVSYQGHGPSGTARWMLPVTTYIFYAGTSDLLAAWTQVTDADGGYCTEINGPEGQVPVDIVAKHSHTLSVKKANVPLPGPAFYIQLGTLLEGDADNSDAVSMIDFSILRTTYGALCPACDDSADFNIDGRISILDFSLLRTNYTRSGPIIAGAAPLALAEPSAGVTLTLAPATIVLPPGVITAALDIVLQAADTPIDGVDVFLDFNPACLAVSDSEGAPAPSIEVGGAFSTVLVNRVDNAAGHVDVSAGVLEGRPITGTVTVARLYVTPLRVSGCGATTIAFSRNGARHSEAASSGEPVLAAVDNATLDIVRARLWLPVIVWNLTMRVP